VTPKLAPQQHPHGVWLSRKAWNARREYLDKWRDRMANAYSAGATDDAAVVAARRDMALKEHA
jgi:hypothetical protein